MLIPQHIAFIMDGNGRWAQAQGKPRHVGHKAGYEHIPDVLEICYDLGMNVVSGYVWSTENWARPKAEVNFIVKALEQNLIRFTRELHGRGIRLTHSGRRERLSSRTIRALDEGTALTADNNNGVFNLCFNYGGRAELVHAAQKVLATAKVTEAISEQDFSQHLWTADLPDVDLLVRTGGDRRLSNFLLWQSAYACLYFADAYWPDIGKTDIDQAVKHYNQIKGNYVA